MLEELGLTEAVSIAGANSARGATIAAAPEALERVEALLSERGIFHKRLDLDYAFHSPAMDAIERPLHESLAAIRPANGAVAFHSTVTGALLAGTELGASYWWRNIRQPVLFQAAVEGLIDAGVNIFIEIGPHAVLRGYMRDALKQKEAPGAVIATLITGDGAPHRVWNAGCQAVIAGARIDWGCVFPWRGRFVPLPNYPWQRERHWHPVTAQSMRLLERRQVHPLLGYRLPTPDPTWENRLDTKLFPMLADHVVGEATVLPGTAYAELALAAALQWHPGERVEIEELEIHTPLVLEEGKTRLVRVAIAPDDGAVTIMAREHGSEDPWTEHACARVLREPFDPGTPSELLLLPERDPDFDGASHEALTRAAGLAYGPAFRCIDRGWVEGDCAVALLRSPGGGRGGAFHLAPASGSPRLHLPAHHPVAEGRGGAAPGHRVRAGEDGPHPLSRREGGSAAGQRHARAAQPALAHR